MTPVSHEISRAAALGPGLYIHFPWCVKKCPYCDFNSHSLAGELDEGSYIQALIQDFQANGRDFRFATVFLGGGTPSLFSPHALATLLQAVRPQLAADAEITMEANPGAVEHGALAAYRQAGVNRLSIGAQSFSPTMLSRLGRIHSPENTRQTFAEARQGGFTNINLDLMYGLPKQNPGDALADLKQAIALAPEHLSWYQLTIEPKTEFARRPPATPDERAIAAMEAAGHALLADAGLNRYEVSAYARPNAQCRHNLTYWTLGPYLGLGAGAESLQPGGAGGFPSHEKAQPGRAGSLPPHEKAQPGGAGRPHPLIRSRKPRQPRLYLRDPTKSIETKVPGEDIPGEFMMNALRLVNGVDRTCFVRRTGLPWQQVAPIWAITTDLGLTQPHRIAATDLGYRHLDRLVQFFL